MALFDKFRWVFLEKVFSTGGQASGATRNIKLFLLVILYASITLASYGPLTLACLGPSSCGVLGRENTLARWRNL